MNYKGKQIASLVVIAFLVGHAMADAHSPGEAPGVATPASAIDDGSDAMVLQWNLIAVQAIGPTAPFPSTRAMATVQLAVFEAVNAITHRYEPYLGIVPAPDGASADAAAVTAAHDTLLWLFPAQQSFLDGKQTESLGAILDGKAKDDGIVVGGAAATAMIANRNNDGSQTPMFYTPTSTAPYEWQPTPSCASAPANGRGLFFHWQFVKPFGVESASQFRAEPPPEITGGKYAKDLNEIASVGAINSTVRTEHEADVARFYAAQPPHRGWNLVARQLASARADEITRTARMLAMLNMSLADGHITVFETKYHYRGWRPETAIQRAAKMATTRRPPTRIGALTSPRHAFPVTPPRTGSAAAPARDDPWAGVRTQAPRHHDVRRRHPRCRAALHRSHGHHR